MRNLGELQKLSHLAWVLHEVIVTATLVRERGRCLGDLRIRHLALADGRLERATPSWYDGLVDTVRMRIHEHRGHDEACHLLGVSSSALDRLIRASSRVRGRELLREAVREGIEDCVNLRHEQQAALRAWERVHGRVPNHTLLVSRITGVITPECP